MLVLINLSLFFAVHRRALSFSSSLINPRVHMNQSARQRKKSPGNVAGSEQRTKLKEAKISFQPNKFLVMQYTHIVTLVLVGLFISLYFFLLSSEASTSDM